MQHPFAALKPEYTHILSVMKIRPDKQHLVDAVAARLLKNLPRYQQVTAADGVPVVFIAPSFEREASSNFRKNPAQGWPIAGHSAWIPHNGPFKSWFDAAIAAYHLNGLDRVGPANWTWELVCFYGELFNGMGYRDFHRMHSPYLWGGTNIQTVGKYTSDGKFDANHMDEQLGMIPVAKRMAELEPSLDLPGPAYVPSPPIASGLAVAPEHAEVDVKWVQAALNTLGLGVDVDGSYGRDTMHAVRDFQRSWGIEVDGLAGPQTIAALKESLQGVSAT